MRFFLSILFAALACGCGDNAPVIVSDATTPRDAYSNETGDATDATSNVVDARPNICEPRIAPRPLPACFNRALLAYDSIEEGNRLAWQRTYPACHTCIEEMRLHCATTANENPCAQQYATYDCCLARLGCETATCFQRSCKLERKTFQSCVDAHSECAPDDVEAIRQNCKLSDELNDVHTPNEGEGNSQTVLLFEGDLATEDLGVDIHFDVPDDIVSIGVTIVGQDDDLHYVDHWVDGAGKELVEDDWLVGLPICLDCQVRVTPNNIGTALLPNGDETNFARGMHQLRAEVVRENDEETILYIRVVGKRAEEIPQAGILNLNVFLSGTRGWQADTADNEEELQSIFEDVERIFAQANISLGEIRYYDISPAFRIIDAIHNTPESEQDSNRMLREGARAELDGINIFMIDALMTGNGNGGILFGRAGGIPGPTGATGEIGSGVIIAVESHRITNESIANTVAHELGHQLGLFHSSENGRLHDPLSDTARYDSDNLMYFAPDGHSLSPNQSRIMRANPWVRH